MRAGGMAAIGAGRGQRRRERARRAAVLSDLASGLSAAEVVAMVAPRPNQPCVPVSKLEDRPVVFGGRPGGPETSVTLTSSM